MENIKYTETLKITTKKGEMRIGEIIAIETGSAIAAALFQIAEESPELPLNRLDGVIEGHAYTRNTLSVSLATFNEKYHAENSIYADLYKLFQPFQRYADFYEMDTQERLNWLSDLVNAFQESYYIAGLK